MNRRTAAILRLSSTDAAAMAGALSIIHAAIALSDRDDQKASALAAIFRDFGIYRRRTRMLSPLGLKMLELARADHERRARQRRKGRRA
jgi:hypothetical protein